MLSQARIRVRGVVQGVGFRPFIHRLASESGLNGWVRNTSGAVEVEVEGDESALRSFVESIEREAPPRSRIEGIEASFHPVTSHSGFEILPSCHEDGSRQLISPDISICEDCRNEILTAGDRRHRYPFTNCTNCGPRFTIIKDIPYDRLRTTMSAFDMCSTCQSEYDDPRDRRFHAQPNACGKCGPSLRLVDSGGGVHGAQDVLTEAAELLVDGNVLAVKGLGGFHLVCDATNEGAVRRLRERKRRPSKPLAVMFLDSQSVEKHCILAVEERALLESPESPIVLVRWKRESSGVSPAVAPNQRYLGVMLAYTPLHALLLADVGRPLVMTSGNLSGEPLAKDNEEAQSKLGPIADYFVFHDRDIHRRCDDSVCVVTQGAPQIVRRARGYAPDPILLPFEASPTLGCGAELKNTICLIGGNRAFLSQHIGDMDSEETLRHFEETVAGYRQLFRLNPVVVAYDMHPDYAATKYALDLISREGLRGVPVQHHHAHVASCLVDNQIEGPVLGVALDGTGYGLDRTVWGGEFLVADYAGFQRVGHFEPVPMPGGEAAIKRPYRMALGYLFSLLGPDVELRGLPLDAVDPDERRLIGQQIERGLNAPLTSSCGRLFDAVAAMIGVRTVIDYEAQAAIELEMAAPDRVKDLGSYPFSLDEMNGNLVIRLAELLAAIAHDVRTAAATTAEISGKFHNTVARAVSALCERVAEHRDIERVALTGGVLQNRLLLALTVAALEEASFEVLIHHRVPCNDGGISLGQAVIAHASSRLGE
ncbi:MAG: carbamoyltransferase HypF [Candidatus Bipolaricaulia bacterium]